MPDIRWGVGANTVNTVEGLATAVYYTNAALYGIRVMLPEHQQTKDNQGFPNASLNIATTRAISNQSGQTLYHPDYTWSRYTTVNGRYSNPLSGVGNEENFMVCGVSAYHGIDQGTFEPVFFGEFASFLDDADYISDLLDLPLFQPVSKGGFGITPASTTDRDILTNQLYEEGMWILRDGFLPPINVDCELNYVFDYEDTWNGGTTIKDWRPYAVPNSGNLNGTNLGWQAWTNPWCGVIDLNGAAYITVPNSILSTSTRTSIEWAGQRTGTGGAYISDARGGSGTWLLTYYNGFEFNWNGQIAVNGSSFGVTNAPQKRHHGVMTANSGTNTSAFYYGNFDNGYIGQVASGTANATLPKIGPDLVIGARYTFGSIWPGEFAFYRIWADELTDIQARICFFHEQSRIGMTPPI